VDIAAGTCSCGRYQENEVPCGHGVAFIYKQRHNLANYLPAALSQETWAATYATPMPAIDIEGLEINPDTDCNPPQTRVPRGRPRKKRLDRAEYRASRGLRLADMGVAGPVRQSQKIPHRCRTCGREGHNAARCRESHM
jgi:SWIM zinc finger